MRIQPRALLAAALAASLAACSTPAGGDVAATVNGTVIERSGIEATVRELTGASTMEATQQADSAIAATQADVLGRHIDAQLVRSVAQDRGLTVDDAAIDDLRQEVLDTVGGEEGLAGWLEQQRITRQLFEETALVQEASLRALLRDLAGDEQVEVRTARHILVQTESEAEDVLAELEDGADFAELASERSMDPGSAAEGGELSAAPRGSFTPPFDDAVWDAELGTVVGPVETSNGFHVLEVVDESTRDAAQLPAPQLNQLVGDQLNEVIQPAYEAADVELGVGFGTWSPESGVVPPARVGEPGQQQGAPLPGAPEPTG